MPTIADIARACGTSKATVSKVLNGSDQKISASKREEILLTISRLQYQPSAHARSLSKRRANVIGVVTCQVKELFNSQYYSTLINSILDEATAHKQTLALFNGQVWVDENHTQLVFADGRCDGLIIINAPSLPGLVPALLRTPMPFVTVNSENSSATLPFVVVNSGPMPASVHSVDIDNVNVGQMATRHLLQQGHRRIAFFPSYPGASFSQERLSGYRMEIEAAGLPYDESLVFPDEGLFLSGYDRGRRIAANAALGVTAICCASDRIALTAIQGLKDSGCRVPEDYSVIGVDDIPDAAHSMPPLTTVSQSLDQMGAQAARILMDVIENPAMQSQKIVWPTELKIRNSVASINR